MPLKQKLKAEEKAGIVQKYIQGRISVSEGAREAGADYETLRRWIRICENHGIGHSGLLPREDIRLILEPAAVKR